jgi:signal transduction histidine kinase/YHS domain-containing protein
MPQILIDEADLHALQQRASAMAHGDLSAAGQPVSDNAAVEDLRRAIDVLGAHTAQGLRQQHAYIAALSTAQEAERGRLARELHDDVVQQLIALVQGVDRVQRLMERDPSQAAERLREMRTGMTTLVEELRAVIGALRPPALEELGLLPALELLFQRNSGAAPAVSLTVTGAPRRLAPQSELALFRIAQEAWSNILRHAQARRVTVTLDYTRDWLLATIADDGVGFAPPAAKSAPDGHWGVRGMRERAELAGGHLHVMSRPGHGTRIEMHIPYPGVGDRDPVCGMAVEPDAIGVEHDGELYRFCSPACRDLFVARPGHYVAPE